MCEDTEKFFSAVLTELKLPHGCHVPVVSESALDSVANGYRILRNQCAGNHGKQTAIRESNVYKLTRDVLLALVSCYTHFTKCSEEDAWQSKVIVAIRCGIQFMGNFITGNAVNQGLVWTDFQKTFRLLLTGTDSKVADYTCMMLHNMSSCHNFLLDGATYVDIVDAVTVVVSKHESEWGTLLLEKLTNDERLFINLYPSLSVEAKITILDFMSCKLSAQDDSTSSGTSIDCLQILCAEFVRNSDIIFATSANDHDSEESRKESLVLVRLLRLLCVATSDYCVYGELRNNHHVLVTAVKLLQRIHVLGKTGDNVFTACPKLADLPVDGADNSHPVNGFKRDLIRLIGNLCYQHRENQDKVRKMDGISLILDCCNIDGKNPFILQWSVFAIRNLCDGNAENKAYIAALNHQGNAPSPVLIELGISLSKLDAADKR